MPLKAEMYALTVRADDPEWLGVAYFDQIPAVGTTVIFKSTESGTERYGSRWLVSVVEQVPADYRTMERRLEMVEFRGQVCSLILMLREPPK